jgi:hypothetical protein
MPRSTLTFRPSEDQRHWLDAKAKALGIPKTTLMQLLVIDAMKAEAATSHKGKP